MAGGTRFAHTLGPVRGAAYELQQRASSAVLRRRRREAFADVEAFLLFIGYPRSGHSIVGACVNAHRDAVVSHELGAQRLVVEGCSRDVLYSRILARASWFNLRGNRTNYAYSVAGEWQGRFETLRVIGDKRGGAVTRCIAERPDFLDRVRSLVEVPLRLLHVVRNPFDNIAAISIWHELPVEAAADYYFRHCDTTARLASLCEPSEVLTVRHEQLIRRPEHVLAEVCGFLGLERYAGYVENCAAVVFESPTYTRRRVAWPGALVREIEERIERTPVLRGYGFATPRHDAPPQPRPVRSGGRDRPPGG